MADLLKSLIAPNNHEDRTEKVQQLSSQTPASPNKADAHGSIRVYGVDAYLADPANAALLKKDAPALKQGNESSKKINSNEPFQPVQSSTHTSHYVSLLYQLCQTKNLTPVFDIEGQADQAIFVGTLALGDNMVKMDHPCSNKKEVRERLAEQGIEIVKSMEAKKKESSGTNPAGNGDGAGKEPNYVGMLQEYHNLEFASTQSPTYAFYSAGQTYACTVTIPSHPDKTFGSPTSIFLGKKQAQRTAASEAVHFLISEGKLNPNGSTIARKKVKSGGGSTGGRGGGDHHPSPSSSATLQANGAAITVAKDSTYAQKINDIAPLLGLNTPAYHLHAESMSAPSLLSGYVTFPNSSGLPSNLGEVKNVFGKKAAKEEVARGAWEVLVKVAEGRGVQLREGE